MAVEKKPDGYHQVTPYLLVRGAADAIEFYEAAFGAKERMRLPMPDGRVGHAELQLGDSVVMLADEVPERGWNGPQAYGGTTVSLLLYVDDVDAQFAQALRAGAKTVRAVQDQFYGDRAGTLTDPFGHIWTLATHVEDVSPEAMRERMAAMSKEGCGEA